MYFGSDGKEYVRKSTVCGGFNPDDPCPGCFHPLDPEPETVVILVDLREADGDSTCCFVGSSWEKVEAFVSDPDNFGFSDQEYFWWAQENVVDCDDIVYSTRRVRTYDDRGNLMEESDD